MKKIPRNLLKKLEKSWKYHGILSVQKSGNPDPAHLIVSKIVQKSARVTFRLSKFGPCVVISRQFSSKFAGKKILTSSLYYHLYFWSQCCQLSRILVETSPLCRFLKRNFVLFAPCFTLCGFITYYSAVTGFIVPENGGK